MARTTDMGKLQDILAGLRAGYGILALSRKTGAHQSVIRRLKRTAEEDDLDALLPCNITRDMLYHHFLKG